jgi:hypothetical protein
MNRAWQQKLLPTPKLILMALCDAANDSCVCWQSVSTVGQQCRNNGQTKFLGIPGHRTI